MGYDKFMENDFLETSARQCEVCSNRMKFKGSGRYECEVCGHEFYTAFGKIKKYLAENGPKNAFEISSATGVPRARIYEFIREGRIEVTQRVDLGQKYCASCGVAIEFGNYCMACARRIKKMHAADNKGVYNMLLSNQEDDGKMRFAGKKEE